MKHSEIAALMKGIAPVLRDFVRDSVKPLAERVTALEGGKSDGAPVIRNSELLRNSKLDPEKLADDIYDCVSIYVQRCLEPMRKRIAELEARPVPKYLGVWKQATYTEGSLVTDRGSVWHCNKSTETRPGSSADWTLCVKGRDA